MNEPIRPDSEAVADPPTFGLRALSKLADLLVLTGLQLALFCFFAWLDAEGLTRRRVVFGVLAAYLLLCLGYFAFWNSRGRQTWGYRLAGLRLVTERHGPVGGWRSLGRASVDCLALALLQYGVGLVDYLPIALSRSKQAFHDRLTRTTVIRIATPRRPQLAICAGASIVAPFVVVFLIVRPFFLQAFYMPSPSMIPTLQIDDHFLLNKVSYRLHPILHEDVVVFSAPRKVMTGHPDFVKRVAGLPGDTVRTTRGRVLIGGQEFDHAAVRNALGQAGVFGAAAMSEAVIDQALHHVKFVPDGVLADGKIVPAKRLAEIMAENPNAPITVQPGRTWRNGKPLNEPFLAEDPDYDLRFSGGRTLLHRYDTEARRDQYQAGDQEIVQAEYDYGVAGPEDHVPAGQLMVFGDNRNDSNDSAYWGYLPESAVEGKATLLFYPQLRRL